MKRLFLILYRSYWDFPRNWAHHGWKPDEMTADYWDGR